MTVLADAASSATPYLIGLVGSSGVLGAVIALYKLRGDRDSQAVETMETVLEALERSLERANARGDFYRHRCEELEAKLERVNRQWGPFPIDEET